MTLAKACVSCGEIIPTSEVQLAPDVDERCHDCADCCGDPDCSRCSPTEDYAP
jgi:hypothetical protein